MFKFGKRGQMTVYVADDVQRAFTDFASDHPIASASDITNAALRVYLPLAQKGVDGRLMPFKLPEPLDTSAMRTLRDLFDDLTKRYEELNTKYEAQRRVVWNEKQREAFRSGVVPAEDTKTRRKAK